MGQSNQSTLSDQKQLTKMFSIQGRVKEHNLTYLQHLQTNKQYLLRQAIFNQETEELEMLTKLKQRQGFSNTHLTNLIKFQHHKKQDLCSKYYRVHSLWEYPRRTLAEEINQRALAKQPFPPGQIKLLVRHMAQAMTTLQKQKITHQCLTSKTILVQGPTTFRIVDPIAIPMHHNLQVLYHKRSIKNIYLSPQQCKIIQQQDINKLIVDPYRSDVFTAGMLILEAGLLQRQDDCYEDDCSKVNWRQVGDNINKFGELYGGELKGYVDMMLARQLSHRIHWDQLIEEMESQRRQSFGRMGARVDTQYVSKTQESLKRSFASSSSRNPPPISVHSRTNNIPQNRQNILIQEPIVRKSQQQYPSNLYPPPPNIQQQQFRPQTYNPQEQNRIYQPIPQPRPEVVVHPPTSRAPVQPVFHYPVKQQIPQVQKEIIPEIRQPSTNIKAYNQSQPKTTPSEPQKSELSPPPLISQPQPIIQFDQNEPIYSIDQFKNGSKYEGYKFKGKREGWGKYTYQEGGCYQGQWKNDLMCGRGKLFYQSGKLAYQGYLQNDLFHGTGTLYNQMSEQLSKPFDYRNFQDIDEYWVSYQGQFRHDKKQGQGKLTLSNGQWLQGSFHEDKVEGEGIYSTMTGQHIKGVWHQNRFQRQI